MNTTTTTAITRTATQLVLALVVTLVATFAWVTAAEAKPGGSTPTAPAPPTDAQPAPTGPGVQAIPPTDPGFGVDPAPVTAELGATCTGYGEGDVTATVTNNAHPGDYAFRLSAKLADDPGVPVEVIDVAAPGETTTVAVGPWDDGAEVFVVVVTGVDVVVTSGTVEVDCGWPEITTDWSVVCLSPGGAHVLVEMTNHSAVAGGAAASLTPVDPQVPTPGPEGALIGGHSSHTFDFGVHNGATYQLVTVADGRIGLGVDTTLDVDCTFIDDTVQPAEPTPVEPTPDPHQDEATTGEPAPASAESNQDEVPTGEPAPATPDTTGDESTSTGDDSEAPDGPSDTDDGSTDDGSVAGGTDESAAPLGHDTSGGGSPVPVLTGLVALIAMIGAALAFAARRRA